MQPERDCRPAARGEVTPQGATVLVVGAKDVVEVRPVKLGALQGDRGSILERAAAGRARDRRRPAEGAAGQAGAPSRERTRRRRAADPRRAPPPPASADGPDDPSLLHRSPRLRVGHRARHPVRRHHRAALAADRAVSVDRAAVADDQRRPIPAPTPACSATNVTQVIEQELNGVEGFLYMSSSQPVERHRVDHRDLRAGHRHRRRADGRAEPPAPRRAAASRRRSGARACRSTKANAGFLMIVALTSKSGAMQTLELGNFAVTRVVDELRRVAGVGDVRSFSSEYAMRIWLDPDKLASFSLSPADALARGAGAEQPVAAAGQLGDRPLAERQRAQRGDPRRRAASPRPSSSRTIILRANPDGSAVRLGDVARVELGAQSYLLRHRAERQAGGRHGDPAHPGRQRARRRRKAVKARMAELRADLPAGHRLDGARTTRRRSSARRSRKWWRRWSRRWCSSSS